jgi:GT2 family glycosyltransferase
MNKPLSFFGAHHNPYYIHAPNYRQSSAGVRALHYLCHFLNECGYEAYISTKITRTGLRTPPITGKILLDHYLSGKNPIILYPETSSKNPLNGATVARWLLNKPGHLGGEEKISADELIFYFESWVLPDGVTGEHFRIPTLDSSVFHNRDNEFDNVRQGFCYYAHKFLRFGGHIPDEIKREGISLGQERNLSHEEIASQLRRAKALYCFEQSALITEARACGCPVFLVPSDYCPASEWTLPPGTALSTNPKPLDKLQGELRACFQREEQEQLEFAKHLVTQFITRTQSAANSAMASVESYEYEKKSTALWLLPAAKRIQYLNAFKSIYRSLHPDIDVDYFHTKEDDVPLLASKALSNSNWTPWLARRKPTPEQWNLINNHLKKTEEPQPFFNIIIIETAASSKSTHATLDSLERQPYPHFSVRSATSVLQDSQPPKAHSLIQRNAWTLFVHAGVLFLPSGLLSVALELSRLSDCRALYADEIVPEDGGTMRHCLRPDFNLDMLLSYPSGMARHWFFRSDILQEALDFNSAHEETAEFEWLLHLIETDGVAGLCHVHEPLVITSEPPLATEPQVLRALQKHVYSRGYENAMVEATLPGRYRILYGHTEQPLVSIIIPTKDQFALLERCVSSLLEKTEYPHYEVLLVDNGSTDPAACTWLDGLAALGDPRIRVLRYPQPFNYATMNNLAAQAARGDYLLLLNNDTAIVHGNWLDAMLNHAQRPEVGVVGAKLLYPNGQVQHAGLLLGLHGMAGYPFSGAEADAPGYMHRLEIDQNYSAVSAACLMVRRSLYNELGGMDAEAFPLICGDMDLCLRARAAGYLTVWTPHAVLLHEKGASLTSLPPEVFTQHRENAQDAMYRRWLPALAHDPAYNRNLSLQSTEFAVETDTRLNWNPLPWRPLPVVLAVNADMYGCGHYRIIHPGEGMIQAGLADVRVSEYHYGPIEMERLQPDTWVLQRLVSDSAYDMVRRTAPYTRAFKVAELDDYLLNLPMKNGHRGQLPSDMSRVMRRWLELSDRLVVSTAPLADALRKMHSDIRVVHNRLPPAQWAHLNSKRRQGRKPRIGWAGGASHQGDLELIADVVRALAGEVEWVFLGMCPEPMRPYLHEQHTPVPINLYPQKLASLNLDLAVAPLEQNLFNDCKSNLKLLEYGACGYPVVCSDVAAYRCGLPVTRVKNRYKDWVEAIRMHLADLDATASAGDALRTAIRQDWMLEKAHLNDWLRAWLPN